MDYESLLELVKERRSIRSYKPEPIPDEYVAQIIEAARWAPSGANSQPWEFVVVKQREIKDKIVEIALEARETTRKMELTRDADLIFTSAASPLERPGYQGAPVFIILCGDPRTKEVYPLSSYYERGDSIFTSSLASAFVYMHLAATSLGLGSQWVSSVCRPLAQALIKQLLGIPTMLQIYDMMAVGYPAYKPGPRPVREIDEMVHYNGYDKTKLRTDEGIRNFIVMLRRWRSA
jgi:nitroreductase